MWSKGVQGQDRIDILTMSQKGKALKEPRVPMVYDIRNDHPMQSQIQDVNGTKPRVPLVCRVKYDNLDVGLRVIEALQC